MEDIISRKPWLFDLRSSKQLIGLAVFSTTFTDGFLYGIVCVSNLSCQMELLTLWALF